MSTEIQSIPYGGRHSAIGGGHARRRLLLGFCAPAVIAAAGLGGAGAAAAQGAGPAMGPQIEEVVVTARRTEEKIQDVPVAITALSGEALTTRGVTNVVEIVTAVPGVFNAPGSSRGSSAPVFGIRGQINREPNATNDPSVGLYFGEVPWARPNGVASAFVDLQSVQVLKGPQGTLFGRNSTAGAILITPNAPTRVFEGYVKVTGGDYGLMAAEAVVNVPLSDQLSVRLVGSREQRDGYMTDVVSGRKTNDVNNYNFRAAVKWSPTDQFSTTTIGSYFKSNTDGEASRLYRLSPAPPSAGVAGLYPRFQAALAATNALGKYQFFSSFNTQTQSTLLLGVPQVFLTSQYARTQTWTLQNTSELSLGDDGLLGDASLKNIASVRRVASNSTFETVPVPFLNIQAAGAFDMWQYTDELQLQGSSSNLDYIVGLFYFRESGADVSASYSVVPSFSILDNKVRNTSYSAFAHFSYDLSSFVEGLNLTAGGRITRDERYIDFRNRRQTTPGNAPNPLYTCFLQPTVPANDGSLCHFPAKATFTEPTWDVGLNYKVSPGSMVYATIARGYRSGGFTQGAQALTATVPFKPEKDLNYEIGSKSDFDLGGMTARLNLAGYYTDYRDLQRTINNLTIGGGIVNTTFNAAKAHIWGAEADFILKPTSDLEISLSYAYTAPKYDKFNDVFREATNGVNYTIDVSDSTFILNSKHAISANVSYTLPVAEKYGRPTISANYYYRSSFFVTNDINTTHCSVPGDPNPAAIYVNCYLHGGKLPGYGLVNARLDWRNFLGSNVDLGVFVKNVANKYYFPNGLNALSALGTMAVQAGPPRMFGIELRAPFGAMAN